MSRRQILLLVAPLALAACGDGDPKPTEPTGTAPPTPPTEIQWDALSTDNAPAPRNAHTAVWTGKTMIVWGGEVDAVPAQTNTGAIYDPAAKTWKPTSTTGAPLARKGHTAVWTGSKMLVWGGYGVADLEPMGGVYDPATDTWSPMSTTNQASPRFAHTATWIGSKMVVWGGANGPSVKGDGAMYDPTTDTWTAINGAGAPTPRRYHGAAASDKLLVVWSGYNVFDWLNDGAFFDPTGGPTGVWIRSTNSSGAPERRERATFAWTGKSFITWGGWTGGPHTNTGGLLDADTNTWTPTNMMAPAARADHVGIWAGNHLLVWGGCTENLCTASNIVGEGGQYSPEINGGTWYPVAAQPALAARYGATGVYTGNSVIIWGGFTAPQTRTNTGAEAPL